MKKLRLSIFVITVIAIAGVIGGFLYWHKGLTPPAPRSGDESAGRPAAEETAGLGSALFERAQNPLKGELPETNPFQVNTNPFEGKINPVEGIYENPFD